MSLIPVYQPSLNGQEKKYVNACLDSNWISSKGEFIEKFENTFAQFTRAPFALSVFNGTVALHVALKALALPPGSEIIVPTLTYVASVNTIVEAGYVPVFADSTLDTWQLDVAQIKKHITPKTRAIMAVHLYGQMGDMHELKLLCEQHQLKLIEDCAEAFGSSYQSQHAGTIGDVGTFSFYGNKTITTGEGGMVICRDEQLFKRMAKLKNQGVCPEKQYWHDVIAYNYRMTNIQAAIGLAQLEQADWILKRKKEIAAFYRHHLQDISNIQFQKELPDRTHSYWMFSILLNQVNDRDPLRQYLAANGIETRPLFYPVHTMPMYQHLGGHFPNADWVGTRGLNLPSYPGLTEENLEYITKNIRLYFQSKSNRT